MLAPLLYSAVGLYMGQDTSIDLKQYHWYNAYAFLTGRYQTGIDFLPSGIQFFYNPLLDVPFYLLATALSAKTAAFILGVFQGLNICLLFLLSYFLLPIENTAEKTAVAIAASVTGVTGAMALAEIGTNFGDNTTAVGILLSLLAIIFSFDALQASSYKKAILIVLAAGLPSGLMTGLKLTNAISCIGLCGALLFITSNISRNFILGFFFGIGVLTGFFVTYGYWGHYLNSHYQSPVFRYMNQLFRSPLFPPAHLGEAYFNPPRPSLFPIFPFLFTLGKKAVTEGPWRDFRVLVWYVFLGIMAIKTFPAKNTPPEGVGKKLRFLLALSGITYLAWFKFFRIYRYLLPLEMLSPLLVLLCLQFIMPAARKAKMVIAAALMIFVLVSIQIPQYGRKEEWTKITDVAGIDLGGAKNPMVLMGGNASAYAFMLPAFPPDVSFVRLEIPGLGLLDDNNPLTGKAFAGLVRKRLEEHHGDFLWFAPQDYPRRTKVLDAFNFKISGQCRKVTDLTFGAGPVAAPVAIPQDKSGDNTLWPISADYELCPVARK
jgi:hypothetical protein